MTLEPIGDIATVSLSEGAAIPDSVIDHFEESLYEDQNLTLSDRYTGNVSAFSRQKTTVKEGSYALGTPDDTNKYVIVGTDTYGQFDQGETVRWNVYIPGGGGTRNGLIFGAQDTNNYYTNHTGTYTDKIAIRKVVSGEITNITEVDVTVPSGEWLEGQTEWSTSGDITFTLFDSSGSELAQTSTTDTTFSDGEIGWHRNSRFDQSETAYFDDLRKV